MSNKPFYYLAGPYTSKQETVQIMRGHEHCQIAALLLKEGYIVYSPIAETMNLAEYGDMHDTSWETWREKDLKQLSVSDAMIILTLDGWKDSIGLRGEIKYCLQNNLPIYLFNLTILSLVPTNKEYILKLLNLTSVNELND